jgi:hypothetical protein
MFSQDFIAAISQSLQTRKSQQTVYLPHKGGKFSKHPHFPPASLYMTQANFFAGNFKLKLVHINMYPK